MEDEKAAPAPPEEDLEVLERGDELILDGLLGEPPPAGPLEAMLGGGFGEVAFLQPLPARAITSRGWTMRLTPRPLQKVVARITIETASRLGAGATRGQTAAPAHSRSCPIIIVTPMAIEVMSRKSAAGRTLISVPCFVIWKTFRRVDALLLVVAQPAAQIAHVWNESPGAPAR